MIFTIGIYAEKVQEATVNETISLSLEEAIDIAIENSIDVSNAEMEYEIARLNSADQKSMYKDSKDQKINFASAGSIESQMKSYMKSKGYNYKLSLITKDYSEKTIEYTKNDVKANVINLYYNFY